MHLILYGICVKPSGREKRHAYIIHVLQTVGFIDKLRLISTAVWLIAQYKNGHKKSGMLSIKFSVRGSTGFCKKQSCDTVLLFELNRKAH